MPLEHYIFPAGGEGLHLVVDNKGRFRENNFQVLRVLRIRSLERGAMRVQVPLGCSRERRGRSALGA